MKFAIIETGGKQYKIAEGDNLRVEKIVDAQEGEVVIFDKVLLLSDGKDVKIGTPYLEGVHVEAGYKKEGRAKKITVIRYKAKSRYFKKKGHRQPFADVAIQKVA